MHPAYKNLSDEEVQNCFEDHFFRDVEKWFSSDIACCDSCYDEFLRSWPLANIIDADEFQSAGLSLMTLYSGGYLRDAFTEVEFKERIVRIECPNCGRGLKHSIWAYNLPIDVTDEMRKSIDEVSKMAQDTPSLVLRHKLASRVLEEVLHLSSGGSYWEFGGTFVRARTDLNLETWSERDFLCPPKGITKEGRYNHAGAPVLYLADGPQTCFYEMRQPKGGIQIADLIVVGKYLVLDLVRKSTLDESIFQALVWSSLLSSPEEGDGWHKPHYSFTRFLADCAKFAKFDAIRYPSVRKGKGSNLVLLRPDEFAGRITVSNIRSYSE